MLNNAFLYTILLIILGIIAPLFVAHAELSINEVAWMGTSSSQYEEWVELYNDGDDINVSGWKLFKTGNTVLFSLTGTIPSNSYYLICRSTSTLTDPLGGICNEKGTFGGSGLNNTSDQLILKDSAGAIKQTIDATAGWPAGESASKNTMQWDGHSWITAASTPGAETLIEINPDPSPTPDPDPSPNPDPDPVPNPNHNPKPTTDPKEKIEKVKPDPVYKAHMVIPDFGTAGIAIPMKATVTENGNIDYVKGRFEWSTGDGGSYQFIKNIPLDHIYYYPGTYTVTMQYYSNHFATEPDTIHRKTITIVPSDIEILGYSDTTGLQLKNGATKEISLDNWIIQSNGNEFVFPKFTSITKGQTLSLSPKVLGIAISKESILLLNPSREIIAGYSYKYTQPANEEVFTETPDLSGLATVSPYEDKLTTSNPLPKTKTLFDLWHENKWYVLLGIMLMITILAYLAFQLYAKPDEELL